MPLLFGAEPDGPLCVNASAKAMRPIVPAPRYGVLSKTRIRYPS